jgi:hypothetical protein
MAASLRPPADAYATLKVDRQNRKIASGYSIDATQLSYGAYQVPPTPPRISDTRDAHFVTW